MALRDAVRRCGGGGVSGETPGLVAVSRVPQRVQNFASSGRTVAQAGHFTREDGEEREDGKTGFYRLNLSTVPAVGYTDTRFLPPLFAL